jgi:hypothetical protein
VAQAVSGHINSVFRFLCASVFVDATLFTVNIYNKSVTSAQLYVAVRMLPLSLINLIPFFGFFINLYGLKLSRK